MSETTTPPVVETPVAVKPPAPLVSSSPANQGTAAASGLSAGSLLVVITWILSLAHVNPPPEVVSAVVPLVGAGVHWLVLKYAPPNP